MGRQKDCEWCKEVHILYNCSKIGKISNKFHEYFKGRLIVPQLQMHMQIFLPR
jgi:hypothetical protein